MDQSSTELAGYTGTLGSVGAIAAAIAAGVVSGLARGLAFQNQLTILRADVAAIRSLVDANDLALKKLAENVDDRFRDSSNSIRTEILAARLSVREDPPSSSVAPLAAVRDIVIREVEDRLREPLRSLQDMRDKVSHVLGKMEGLVEMSRTGGGRG